MDIIKHLCKRTYAEEIEDKIEKALKLIKTGKIEIKHKLQLLKIILEIKK